MKWESTQPPQDMILDLERMSQQWDHGKTWQSKDYTQVVVEVQALLKQVSTLAVLLGNIESSLRELEQSLVEQV